MINLHFNPTVAMWTSTLIMKLIIKIMIFSCFAIEAFAQNTLSPEAAVQASLQNHPLAKAAAFDLKARQFGEKSALNLPNPEVNLESPTGGFYTIGVLQSFEFPTVYARQKQVAKAESTLAQIGVQVSQNEIRYQTRILYLEAQVAELKGKQWRERDTLYQKIAATAAREFEAGEIDFLQKTKVENEAGMVHQERLAAEQTTGKFFLQLREITGLKEFNTLEPLRFDPEEGLFLTSDPGMISPLVQYQQQSVQVAEQQLKLSKSQALPNFSLGYMNQGERNTPIDYRFRASIGVPLWMGQYRANQQMAKAESQAAMARTEAQSQALTLESHSVVAEALSSWSKLDYYEKEALPRSSSLITAAMRMREAGQIDYTTFLRSLDEAYSIQLDYAEQLTALYTARYQMLYLKGI